MSHSSFLRIAVFTLLLVVVQQNAEARCVGDQGRALSIVIDAEKVTVSEGTPRNRMLVVGYGRAWDGERYSHQFNRFRAFLTADENGVLTLRPQRKLASDSVWAAVDLQSGRCGMSIEPRVGRHDALPPSAIENASGKGTRLFTKLPLTYVVVIRPGEGAWEGTTGDGGRKDDDGTVNGDTIVRLDSLEPIGRTVQRPDSIGRGDIVLLFSPQRATVSFLRVED